MVAKRNLPAGILINPEYPSHIQRSRDKLCLALKLAKSIPHNKDKSRLEDDRLVINGINYTLDDLHQLPIDLAVYRAMKKSADSKIVFQGELSPWSNFHKVPFVINGQKFLTSEHWIHFQKALLFNDSATADRIL